MIAPGPPGVFFASAMWTTACPRSRSPAASATAVRRPPRRRRRAARRASRRWRTGAVPLAEGDPDRPGEGGDVDQDRGLEPVHGVRQRVGEDQAALGIGVEHFGRPAAVVRDDVTGADGVAADRVLGGGHHPVTRTGQPQPAQRRHHRHHHGAPGHVALHRRHALAGLDGDAAGVEGDALADQDPCGARRRRAGGSRAAPGGAAPPSPGRPRAPRRSRRSASFCSSPGSSPARPLSAASAFGLLGEPLRAT